MELSQRTVIFLINISVLLLCAFVFIRTSINHPAAHFKSLVRLFRRITGITKKRPVDRLAELERDIFLGDLEVEVLGNSDEDTRLVLTNGNITHFIRVTKYQYDDDDGMDPPINWAVFVTDESNNPVCIDNISAFTEPFLHDKLRIRFKLGMYTNPYDKGWITKRPGQ